MNRVDQILALAREYGRAVGVEMTTVSWRVFDDGKKLAALEAGADIQTRRADRAVAWLAENWPPGAVWPSEIARPSAASAEVTP